jgi:hemoglobin-like flavoprotein
MTREQVDLIRKSFDALWPVRRSLADAFYSRFFALAPDARRMFPDDMERQQLKLMDMIAAIVGALDKREIFQSIIRFSGARAIWGEAITFCRVWRRADMGPGTAVWTLIHSRA